jgi:hypothetical protein
MLDKLGGVFAPKPSPGPHKQRECLPLCLILRNRLKYALTYKEVTTILQQRLVKVDGKIRRDKCYPTGIMDVVSIDKTDEHFRVIYDQKGRFVVHRIEAAESTVRTRARLRVFSLAIAKRAEARLAMVFSTTSRGGGRARGEHARNRSPPLDRRRGPQNAKRAVSDWEARVDIRRPRGLPPGDHPIQSSTTRSEPNPKNCLDPPLTASSARALPTAVQALQGDQDALRGQGCPYGEPSRRANDQVPRPAHLRERHRRG